MMHSMNFIWIIAVLAFKMSVSSRIVKVFSRLHVHSTAAQAWRHAGDWKMEWAQMPQVTFPSETTRHIISDHSSGPIHEELVDRDDVGMRYVWSFTEYPADWQCGKNLKGSCAVIEEESAVIVEYGMETEVETDEEEARTKSIMQNECNSCAKKLVAYIEKSL